jgi:predicted TIM-barrel fold metal-dependent hydrolase
VTDALTTRRCAGRTEQGALFHDNAARIYRIDSP